LPLALSDSRRFSGDDFARRRSDLSDFLIARIFLALRAAERE
jgi:hypothetical protein